MSKTHVWPKSLHASEPLLGRPVAVQAPTGQSPSCLRRGNWRGRCLLTSCLTLLTWRKFSPLYYFCPFFSLQRFCKNQPVRQRSCDVCDPQSLATAVHFLSLSLYDYLEICLRTDRTLTSLETKTALFSSTQRKVAVLHLTAIATWLATRLNFT
jgi:hypothetical protein